MPGAEGNRGNPCDELLARRKGGSEEGAFSPPCPPGGALRTGRDYLDFVLLFDPDAYHGAGAEIGAIPILRNPEEERGVRFGRQQEAVGHVLRAEDDLHLTH